MSEKCLKMTHFDIKFEHIQGFFADGILTNFVARCDESKTIIFSKQFLFLYFTFFMTFQVFSSLFKYFQDFSKNFKTFKDEFCRSRLGAMKAIFFSKQFLFLYCTFLRLFKTIQDFSRLFKTFQNFSKLIKTNFVDRGSAPWKQKNIFSKQFLFLYFTFFLLLFKTFQGFSRLFKAFQGFWRLFKTFHKNLFTKCHFQTQSPKRCFLDPFKAGGWGTMSKKKSEILIFRPAMASGIWWAKKNPGFQ
jgi:hypothetical protein